MSNAQLALGKHTAAPRLPSRSGERPSC